MKTIFAIVALVVLAGCASATPRSHNPHPECDQEYHGPFQCSDQG